MPKSETLHVPVTEAQREYVRRVAEAESTSEAAIVRRLIAQAARAAGEQAQAA